MIKKLLILLFLGGLVFLAVIQGDQLIKKTRSFVLETLLDIDRSEKTLGAGLIRNEQEVADDRFFEGTIDDIIVLVNKARVEAGLKPLAKNELLVQSSQIKAEDMRDKEYFEHISPEGLQPWFFVEQAGYQYKTVGENLAEGFFSVQSVHDGWMNSPGHRENVLSSDFKEIGVAIVEIEQNGRRSYLAAQHFGSQLELEELDPTIVCDKEIKDFYKDAEEKKDEVKETIKEQKKIIKNAKKEGASKKEIEKMEDNLDKLKDIRDNIKEYLKKCDEYIEKCDQWE